jgi:hypothetical protein
MPMEQICQSLGERPGPRAPAASYRATNCVRIACTS